MTPYPYQLEGVDWLTTRAGAILADEPGLGKTCQAILAAARLREYPVLVLCPAGLRLNWAAEIMAWTGCSDVAVVRAGDPWPRATWVICNYDIIHRYAEARHVSWGCHILDEAHYAKSVDARRAQAALSLPCRRRWLLTGTPILNNPEELWVLLAACGLPGLPSRGEYLARFAPEYHVVMRGQRVTKYGACNLEELAALVKPYWLRRRKIDVLPDLPAKREVETILDAPASNDPDMARRRHEDGLMRVPAAGDYVTGLLRGGEPAVTVWFWHRDVGAALRVALQPFRPVLVDGSTSLTQRQRNVESFQAGESRAWIGQVIAAGTGYTLTAAARAVFVESSWSPDINRQAADRIHRIGQRSSVLVETLHVPGSTDGMLRTILRRKSRIAGTVTGDLEMEVRRMFSWMQ